MINNELIRDAWIDAGLALPPRCFVTLVYNYPTRPGPAERTFYEWCRRVGRMGHGAAWEGFPTHLRLRLIGALEDVRHRPHAHACITGSDRLMRALEADGEAIWRCLTRCGHAQVEPAIRSVEGAVRYPFKRVLSAAEQGLVLVYGPDRPSCKRD